MRNRTDYWGDIVQKAIEIDDNCLTLAITLHMINYNYPSTHTYVIQLFDSGFALIGSLDCSQDSSRTDRYSQLYHVGKTDESPFLTGETFWVRIARGNSPILVAGAIIEGSDDPPD